MPPSLREAAYVRAVAPVLSAPALRRKLADYLLLAKPRLSLLVLATAVVGFWLASGVAAETARLLVFAAGTFFVIGGANALNQIVEREQDKLMARTRRRPLPSGRMEPKEAWVVAAVLTLGGLGLIAFGTNALTMALGASAVVTYAAGYTLLKRRTEWSTWVGALAGALPPLMGWAAARNEVSLPALALFAIVFVWQFPHTWAIAWLYREDYERAGYRVLPLMDRAGYRTRIHAAGASVALLAASLSPIFLGMVGPAYLAGALALDALLIVLSLRFAFGRTRRAAGYLLAASLIYLPLLMALLVMDRRSF